MGPRTGRITRSEDQVKMSCVRGARPQYDHFKYEVFVGLVPRSDPVEAFSNVKPVTH